MRMRIVEILKKIGSMVFGVAVDLWNGINNSNNTKHASFRASFENVHLRRFVMSEIYSKIV